MHFNLLIMSFYAIRNSVNNKIVGHYNQVVNAIHHCDVWEDPKFIDRIDFIKINFEPITGYKIASNFYKTDKTKQQLFSFAKVVSTLNNKLTKVTAQTNKP